MIVLEDDNGIRPAGHPDQCFYCGRKVGQEHGPECVVIVKVVRYKVMFLCSHVGFFDREEPYHWTPECCTKHKNQSSWCKSNAVEDIIWNKDETSQRIKKEVNEINCACGVIDFEFQKVVDPGPFRSK